MCKRVKYFRLLGLLAVWFVALWTIHSVDLCAAEKEEIKAYEEFLAGKRKVFIENNGEGLFSGYDDFLTDEMLASGALLEDFLIQVNEAFCYTGQMETVTYAYLDCCKDGQKELAVRFSGLLPSDNYEWTFIIVFEDDVLYLRYAFDSWARSSAELNAYGSLLRDGSGGAYDSYSEEIFLDDAGRACLVYEASFHASDASKSDLGEPVFDETFLVLTSYYTIEDKEYRILEPCWEDIDAKQWETFYALYEQEYGPLYTEQEIEGFLTARRKALGIKEEWLKEEAPDWRLLENPDYRAYIREIDLLEARADQREEKSGISVLNDKWVTCKTRTAASSLASDHGYEVDLFWRMAIEYALSDYCEQAGIPAGTWKLTDLCSYGNGLFAVSLKSEQLETKRELCLLMSSDAVNAGIEEYSQYIAAVDFHYGEEGATAFYAMSYDSMLDWKSYEAPALGSTEAPAYTVRPNEDDFFSHSGSGCYALNQYLKDVHADPKDVWELDLNAICPVGGGRIFILRYVCENHEIVLMLDECNQTFSVVKGLYGKRQPLPQKNRDPKEAFVFRYGEDSRLISRDDCEAIYDKNGLCVYSHKMGNYRCGDSGNLLYFQYALFIETPYIRQQIFPVKDFFVNQEDGILYIVRELADFEYLERMPLLDIQKESPAEEILDPASLEEMFANAYQLSGAEEAFSNLHLEFTDGESNNVPPLKAIASGICRATGKKYYLDFEWHEDTKELAAEPCILKVYDAVKDAEQFEACQKALEQVAWGDWSMVKPIENTEDIRYGMHGEVGDLLINVPFSEERKESYDWRQVDLNGDGLPELVSQNGNGDRTDHKKPISFIFTWQEGQVYMVYIDLFDACEFLFLTDAGELMYEYDVSGGPKTSKFTKYHFDEKWNLAFEESLRLLYFHPDLDTSEEEKASMAASYPNTFGASGSGLYCLRYRPKTPAELEKDGSESYFTEELITEKQFMDAYRAMTGRTFLDDNSLWWEHVIM